MQATPKTYIPDLIGSLGTRSFMLVCLCAAFPMTSNGNPVVEVVQRDVVMSWGINTTDISSNRLVINPAGSTVILFSPNSVIGTVTPAFINRVRDVGNVSLGMASFRLLNLTVADAGRYYYKIIPATDAGGQVLVIAGNPDVSIMEVADPFENNKYTMLCSAQSTSLPPGMGLTMHYQWKNEKGQNIPASDRYSFSSDQSNLTINPLKRQDAGTFVCDAWEHIGAVSQSGPFSLKVFFTTDPPSNTTRELELGLGLGLGLGIPCVITCIVVVIYVYKGSLSRSNIGKGILTGLLIASVIGIIVVYFLFDKLKPEPTGQNNKTKDTGPPANQNKVKSETTSKKTNGRSQPLQPVAAVTGDIPKPRAQPPSPENIDVKDPNQRGIPANFNDKQGLASNKLPPLEDASKEPKKKRKKKNKKKGQIKEGNPEEEMV